MYVFTPLKQSIEANKTSKLVSPEEIRPYPKAGVRKGKVVNRKRGRTRIVTDTPEKEELMKEQEKQLAKKSLELECKKRKVKQLFPPAKRRVPEKSDHSGSESDAESDVVYSENSDEASLSDQQHDLSDSISVGDYVLVKFATKRSVLHYVGLITKDEAGGEYEVKFLKSSTKSGKQFRWSEPEDVSLVNSEDIVKKLPPPSTVGGTARAKKRVLH
ncbi:uncharacterized protein LOC121368245 isoform X1 [Gigantopelta aegis]|uniref:uncharacterized protein LOC121368245 isoform X1 n=1 Tax=Gigantopelta aegis TaxID=1735272 RepID=UPI001B88E108|nr:uncharacterized protein LOC121368245 isoform X1 [Gigantopelta aegis]